MIALDPKRTALLVMDLQTDILPRLGEAIAPLLERTADVLAAARKAGVTVVYVVAGFRPGYPELSPKNPSFASVQASGRYLVGTPGCEMPPSIQPLAGEVVVVKHRVSAFAGTDLEQILRAKGIDTLLLTGVATSGVVLSTVRYGADADYQLVVVQDCCADVDADVHRVLTEKVFVRQTNVVTASELCAALGGT